MKRFKSQQKVLSELAAETHDVLVLGGGIVGAGVARDAAMRGLKTSLIDRHDFAFGTSSRSSRLLHGGIRYLAQGRVGLVREASLEKAVLGRIAPHLAEPRAFIFPTYKTTPWPLWQLRMGVKIYDLLCSGQNFGKSESLSRSRIEEMLPFLSREALTGGVRYFDGFTQDSRLVLDTLRSAQKNGAALANYVSFQETRRDGTGFVSEARDELSGEVFSIKSRTVVNATGPWSPALGLSSVRLRLTKGIHIVIPRSRLPVPDALAVTERNRVLFVLPWGERVIIGTTDTDYEGAPESVETKPQDLEYLLATINQYFPQLKCTEADVISTWAGLRPLIADPRGNPSDISRSHQITQTEPGWWDVAGGKLTTCRLMAEQTVDQLAATLGKAVKRCATAETPLLSMEETTGISGIIPPEFSVKLIEHYCSHEWAVHLDDVLRRRTSWEYYHAAPNDLAARTAEVMSRALEWSPEQKAAELARLESVR